MTPAAVWHPSYRPDLLDLMAEWPLLSMSGFFALLALLVLAAGLGIIAANHTAARRLRRRERAIAAAHADRTSTREIAP